ncbi:MAG TPA: TonB-dependent receptor plug domain-containing protein, partial [Cytophagales bacterium]|nr:TonB-dependent receptor plug domain-containing protein [Cytophagales bacterium]
MSLLTVGFPGITMGQDSLTSLSGIVKSVHHEPIIGALMWLDNDSNAVESDINGHFSFQTVPYGKHRLHCQSHEYITIDTLIEYHASSPSLVLEMRDQLAHQNLGDVVITDKSTAQKIEEQALVVDVIDLSKNHQKASSLAQMLNLSSGIKVRQTSGVGSETNINVNGMQGKAIRFFKDGIPMDYLGRAFNISLIPTSNLERVEVYKGVLPVALGADALGGAVNIITKEITNNNLHVSYALGSFNTHEFTLTSYLRLFKNKAYISTLSYYTTSDNNYWVDIKVDPRTTLKVRRFHDHVNALYTSAKLGLTPSKLLDKAEVELGFFNHHMDLQHDPYMTRPYGKIAQKEKLFHGNLLVEKTIKNLLELRLFTAFSKVQDSHLDTSRNRYNWLGQVNSVASNAGEMNSVASDQMIDYHHVTGRMTATLTAIKNHHIVYSHNYKYTSRAGSNPLGQKIINTDID